MAFNIIFSRLRAKSRGRLKLCYCFLSEDETSFQMLSNSFTIS